MDINLKPKRVFTRLLGLIFLLLIANSAGIISKYYLGHGRLYGLIDLFSFDMERNIPTFFSYLILILCSLILLIITLKHKAMKSGYLYWLGLSILFFFLAIDEIASLHEQITIPVRQALDTTGILYFAWVIPYCIFLIVFVLIYSRFLLSLPKNIMLLFFQSGMIYVTGAVGFELLGGKQYELHGANNIQFAIYYTCEELLEMSGISLFIYALLTYIRQEFIQLNIVLTTDSKAKT